MNGPSASFYSFRKFDSQRKFMRFSLHGNGMCLQVFFNIFPVQKHMANVKFVNTILIFDAQFNSLCSHFSLRIQQSQKEISKIHMILKQLRSEMMAIDLSRLAYFFNCLLLYDYYFRYFTLITRWSMRFSYLNRAKSTFHASNGFHLFLCCRFCFCWTANT